MNEETVLLVLTSAATAAIVSGLVTLVGQHLDRSSKKRQLILEKAVQLAVLRSEQGIRLAEMGHRVKLWDPLHLAESYYQSLEHLVERGSLPEPAKAAHRESLEALEARKRSRTADSAEDPST